MIDICITLCELDKNLASPPSLLDFPRLEKRQPHTEVNLSKRLGTWWSLIVAFGSTLFSSSSTGRSARPLPRPTRRGATLEREDRLPLRHSALHPRPSRGLGLGKAGKATLESCLQMLKVSLCRSSKGVASNVSVGLLTCGPSTSLPLPRPRSDSGAASSVSFKDVSCKQTSSDGNSSFMLHLKSYD